jgi:hypothetical protein
MTLPGIFTKLSGPGSTMLQTFRGSGAPRLSSFGRSTGFNAAIVVWE